MKQNNSWGTVWRARAVHECWGGETRLSNGRDWLISHSPMCDGTIHAGELYLKRKDRRDQTAFWRVSIWCAALFHSDRLDGEWHQYLPLTDEDIERTVKGLQATYDELKF